MSSALLNEIFLTGVKLANLASKISHKYFRAASIKVEHKLDYSPVTVADQEIEQVLRTWIKAKYPTHGVIGEEYFAENTEAKYTWVIDPIDGTVAFTTGKPTFTTLIALLEDGVPVFGIIDQPIINERFVGIKDKGALLNGKSIFASKRLQLSEARLNATTPYMFKTNEEQYKFNLLRERVSVIGWGGDAYSYGLLAAGHIDIIMEAGLQFYDVAALVPIIEESGGVITDWYGNQICYDGFNGQCLASANPKLHEMSLKIIN